MRIALVLLVVLAAGVVGCRISPGPSPPAEPSGRLVARTGGGYVTSLAISPDGTHCLTHDTSDKAVRLWDIARGVELHRWERFNDYDDVIEYNAPLAFGADGRTVVFADCLWSEGGERIRRMVHDDQEIVAVAPAGQVLALRTHPEGTFTTRDLRSGRRHDLDGEGDSVSFMVAISDEGRVVRGIDVSNEAGWELRLWEASTSRCIRTVDRMQAARCVTVSADSRWAAWGGTDQGKGEVRVCDLEGDDPALSLTTAANDVVQCVSFSPDGRLLAAGGQDGRVRLWERATGRELACHATEQHRVTSLRFTPDGRSLLSGGGEGTLRLFAVVDVPPPSSRP